MGVLLHLQEVRITNHHPLNLEWEPLEAEWAAEAEVEIVVINRDLLPLPSELEGLNRREQGELRETFRRPPHYSLTARLNPADEQFRLEWRKEYHVRFELRGALVDGIAVLASLERGLTRTPGQNRSVLTRPEARFTFLACEVAEARSASPCVV